MFKDKILDTLIISGSKIVFKKFHIVRTQEAFRFLNLNLNKDVENCYNAVEKLYADKLSTDECLRIIFFKTQETPLVYTAEIQKINKLAPVIRLNSVFLKKPATPDSAFKWENRESWETLLKKKNQEADDILVVNYKNDIVETSRFNIFCYDEKTQTTYTPELDSGCLNGVFRRYSLSEGLIQLPEIGNKKLIEKNLSLSKTGRYQLFVANSVRGVLKAVLV